MGEERENLGIIHEVRHTETCEAMVSDIFLKAVVVLCMETEVFFMYD